MCTAPFRSINRSTSLLIISLLLLFLAACGGAGGSSSAPPPPPPANAAEFLYAGTSAGSIAAFTVDQNTGALTVVAGSPFSVGGTAVRLAADPAGKALFATNASIAATNIQALAINSSTGGLSVSGSFGSNLAPGAIALDPSGRNAYVVPDPSLGLGFITAFNVDPTTHALTALPGQPTGVNGVPQSVVVDPSGKFVYITIAFTAGNEIAGRLRDQATGALTPITPGSPFGTPGAVNPRGIAATANVVLTANFGSSNVSVESITPATGVLNNIGGSPFAAGTGPVVVALDSAGKFAFVVNQTSNNLSAYTIGAAGGLTPIAGTPIATGTNPQAVAVEKAGKFVYVANGDGTISGFSIAAGTGALTPITGSPFTVAAGTVLHSIVVVHE